MPNSKALLTTADRSALKVATKSSKPTKKTSASGSTKRLQEKPAAARGQSSARSTQSPVEKGKGKTTRQEARQKTQSAPPAEQQSAAAQQWALWKKEVDEEAKNAVSRKVSWSAQDVAFEWAERISQVRDSAASTPEWVALGQSVAFEERRALVHSILALLLEWKSGRLVRKAKDEALQTGSPVRDILARHAGEFAQKKGKRAQATALKLVRWGWFDGESAQPMTWGASTEKGGSRALSALEFCVSSDERKLLMQWAQRNPNWEGLFVAPQEDAQFLELVDCVGTMAFKGWTQETLAVTPLLLAGLQAREKREEASHRQEGATTSPVLDSSHNCLRQQVYASLWAALFQYNRDVDGVAHIEEIASQWAGLGMHISSEATRAQLLNGAMHASGRRTADKSLSLFKALQANGWSASDRDEGGYDLLMELLHPNRYNDSLDLVLLAIVESGVDCTQTTPDGASILSLVNQAVPRSFNEELMEALVTKVQQRVHAAEEKKQMQGVLGQARLEKAEHLNAQVHALLQAGMLRGPSGETLNMESFAALARHAMQSKRPARVEAVSGVGVLNADGVVEEDVEETSTSQSQSHSGSAGARCVAIEPPLVMKKRRSRL